MKSKLGAELMVAATDLEAKGHVTIPLSGLKEYISQFDAEEEENQSTLREAAQRAHALEVESWKMRSAAQLASGLEMFKSVLESGQSALKSLMVLNGGAAVALLAFLGSAFSKPGDISPALPLHLSDAMLWFFIGAGLVGLAFGFRYFSQYFYSDEKEHLGNATLVICVLLGVASAISFFGGGTSAYRTFHKYGMLKVHEESRAPDPSRPSPNL